MAKFKIGDRARVVKSKYPHRIGKECTITGIGPFLCGNGEYRDCAIEYDDGWSIDNRTNAINFDQLEPIIDLGSWDEIQKAINWNPTKEISYHD